ncbi:uncharacterized protein DFL_008591 [Arthrobotrys flagrans]|uniref:Peptidase S26 domain-containing protein n=1 Tax=Arthrobotrys flagrans TaxID=97331 RepID=A0A436ZP67_ARTFL|nr:hypothetical protein DFL_008591 [Arthrobotrys flagrans]
MYRLFSRRHGRLLPLPSRSHIPTTIPHYKPQLLIRRNGTAATSPNGGTAGGGGATPEGDLPWYHPRWRRALTSLVIGIKLLAFTHLVVSKVFIISQCEGPSMLPTLPTSGSVVVNNLYSRGRGIKVGDLIAAHRPDDMDVMLLKRVIGMPGDYVVTDPMAAGSGEETVMVRVPEGHCWIAGDNLSHSIDSRFYGPVPLALIMGKVVAQVAGGRKWFSGPFTEVSKDE